MRTWLYQFSSEMNFLCFKNKRVTSFKCVKKGKMKEVNLLVTSLKEDLL